MRKQYRHALDLAHLQVKKNPRLKNAQSGLWQIYRLAYNNMRFKDFRKLMKDRACAYSRFALAEAYRRRGKLDRAREILGALIAEDKGMPVSLLYLSLARLHYRMNEPAQGEGCYRKAVASITTLIEADLVFQDVKYVLTDAEFKTYTKLKTAAAMRTFLLRLWRERDPVPSKEFNLRLEEHYRRILYAEDNFEYDGFRVNMANYNSFVYPKGLCAELRIRR